MDIVCSLSCLAQLQDSIIIKTARNFKCSHPSLYFINLHKKLVFEIYQKSEPASIFDIRKGV